MGKKKTLEQFIQEVQQLGNNEYEVISDEYVNSHTKVQIRHIKCDYTYEVQPYIFLNGCRCPKCANESRLKYIYSKSMSNDEFIDRLNRINPDIIPLEKIESTHKKIKIQCKICGNIWTAKPKDLLHNHGCSKCRKKSKITTNDFKKEIQIRNPNIEILGEYKNRSTKIKCRCVNDDYIWETTPDSLLRGAGCPKCISSKGERKIIQFLNNNKIIFQFQQRFPDCIDKKELPFDFYLPNYNICIEYDGVGHYNPIECFGGEYGLSQTQTHDKIKDRYCKDNNIKLIRIPYWDFNNIEEILSKELEVG